MSILRLRADEIEEIKSKRLWNSAPAMPSEKALDMLKEHRQDAFQHTWDIVLKPQFMDDYTKLDDATKEHVIAAVSVLANAKYPTTCGHPLGEHAMNAYEVGHCYRIAYRWHTLSHSITLFFVRRSDDAMGGDGGLRLPDPTDCPDAWIQDAVEENLEESYGILRNDKT